MVDVDEIEEFDLDASLTPVPPPAGRTFAQGSETHDRADVARRMAVTPAELDRMLKDYLLEVDDLDDPPPLPPVPDPPRRRR